MKSQRELMKRIEGAKVVEAKDGTRRNRDLNDLICEVIVLCNHEGRRKTHIMYGGNMAFTILDPLVYWMEQVGLIEGRADRLGKVYYATGKGMAFLDLEQQQRHLLGLPEDEPTTKAIREKWEQNGFTFNQKKPRPQPSAPMDEVSVEII